MPPGSDSAPVQVLANLRTALGLPDGGSDYYHSVTVVGVGRDITELRPEQYPVVFIGEPGEVGLYSSGDDRRQALWHRRWTWDIPVFGVIKDQGYGDEAYDQLNNLAADIMRAVMVDHTRGGTACDTQVLGWTILGPQDVTDGRPWVGVHVRVDFTTKDDEMVTVPA